MPREDIKLIDEKDLEIDYEDSIVYHYMPEFLEECYKGRNAEILKSANTVLLEYAKSRSKYKYIGTHKDNRTISIIEYYQKDDGNYVIYLIDVPKEKKYYPSLQMVCECKNKGIVQ